MSHSCSVLPCSIFKNKFIGAIKMWLCWWRVGARTDVFLQVFCPLVLAVVKSTYLVIHIDSSFAYTVPLYYKCFFRLDTNVRILLFIYHSEQMKSSHIDLELRFTLPVNTSHFQVRIHTQVLTNFSNLSIFLG